MSSITAPLGVGQATPRWEAELLDLACTAWEGERVYTLYQMERGLERAEQVTRDNSKSFYLASGLLPQAKRHAVRTLYAFCRLTDDLVDNNGPTAARDLERWRERVLAPHPPSDDALLVAFHDVRTRHRIPIGLVRQLIDGIAADLVKTRYDTFEELARYCYGVASTVGLMSMAIIGYRTPAATPYAVKLGVALQLTNILRDVGEDLERGRVYLPQEDLRMFGYTEDDLHAHVIDSRWRALIDYEIARARALYTEAWDGIYLLADDGRLAIAAAATLYRAILDKIPRNGYDVFTRRAHLGAAEKLALVPGLWFRMLSA